MNKEKPLSGKKILITREKSQAASFARLIDEKGGIPIVIPLVAFLPAENEEIIAEHLKDLTAFDWLIFTSVNGVRFFDYFLKKQEFMIPPSVKIAAVGKKTASRLQAAGMKPNLIPQVFSGNQLADELEGFVSKGDRVLIIRGSLSKQAVFFRMKENRIDVKELILYENKPVADGIGELSDLLEKKEIDYVTFTSPSIVHSFMKGIKEVNGSPPVFVCIGDVTAESLRDYGYDGLIANPYTIEGMVDKIIDHAHKEEI
ncbi:uroporphyrinogen-III synthase [Bacillus sp. FJAT-42376]|uniref:uroporphyrinogen-III synthase n=1 Tax=Bacillus sp. FJAT-42376 TaxID=2014076 RepID=UPI000F4F245F|nr:uroporphyrinogen-III synthase [Bacillus sp. FJAT-42376]AZB43829.1 uroporphyrinogen-III synthase [Bacillus sp. FJAT-42376]